MSELEQLVKVEPKLHDLDFARGHRFTGEDGIEMIEFHVDDDEYFFETADQNTEYGGWLSSRKDPTLKPLLMWGQDECVFHQHRYNTKQWVTPEGQRPLMPKSDGGLLMISAFQSREMGFGWDLSVEQLEKVNVIRRGKKYHDEDAAVEVNGSADKPDLTKSPFKIFFQPGANEEKYWNYSHTVVQLEDIMDCCSALLPEFQHAFLYDSSSLEVGDVQVMVFKEDESGPLLADSRRQRCPET